MLAEKTYPLMLTCKDGLDLEIRPLEFDEIEFEVKLFETLSEADRSKLPNNLLDTNYKLRMKRQIEDGRVITLAAWHKKEVIGLLTFYRGESSWVSHTGRIVTLVHPKFRRRGVATILINEIVPFAQSLGIEKIYVHLLEKHKEAIKLFKTIGFKREATLKDHVKDSYNRYKSVRIYSIDLEAAHRAMEEMVAHYSDYCG
jgi:RimJ/RimL family protein N-acetyltransferase